MIFYCVFTDAQFLGKSRTGWWNCRDERSQHFNFSRCKLPLLGDERVNFLGWLPPSTICSLCFHRKKLYHCRYPAALTDEFEKLLGFTKHGLSSDRIGKD